MESTEFQASTYERRIRAIYLLILMPTFSFVGILIDSFFNIQNNVSAASLAVVSIVLSVYLADRKKRKKFDLQGEK